MRGAWSSTVAGNPELQTSEFLKDFTLLVWGLLVWDFGSWCKLSISGFLAFGHSGHLALLPTWMRALVGLDVGPTRGLDPTEDGSPFLEAGPMLGLMSPWAPASGTV